MSKDRRRYFRIEDWVYLEAQLVHQSELEQKLAYYQSNRPFYSSANERNQGQHDNLADLRAITGKMPELARYLTSLQDQINHLTKNLLPGDSDEQQSSFAQIQKVNLSAQGISFTTDDLFKPADTVELRLKLMPSRNELPILASVVLVEDNEDNEADGELGLYQVSLDYLHIHDSDREIIAKHVHSKQFETLGSRRIEAL